MSPRKRVSNLSLAWRFIVVICTVQIIWSKADTTPRILSQITHQIITTSPTPPELHSSIKDGIPPISDSAGHPTTTEVDPYDSHVTTPESKTTERISSPWESSIPQQVYTKWVEANVQTTLYKVEVQKNERQYNESYSTESPPTGDPNNANGEASISNDNRCTPTADGITLSSIDLGDTKEVDARSSCNESNLNTDLPIEQINFRTSIIDVMPEYGSIIGPETTTGKQSDDFLSRLPNICPYTNICEKSTRENTCCRACSCAYDCGDNCCFRNGTKANYVGSRPECLHVQRELPGKQVSNYKTYKIVRTCQFPEFALFGPLPMMQNSKPKDDSWKYKLSPVFSKLTNITYYNSKYAECNDESDVDIVHWDRIEYCGGFVGQTYEDIYGAIHNDHCDTVYKPPAQYQDLIQECYKIDVDACNIAGEWDFYDEQIEQGCKELRFPYIEKHIFDKHRKPTVFANVFCYLCNSKRNTVVPEFCTEVGQFLDSFTTMLSYTDEDAIMPVSEMTRSLQGNDSTCGDYQIVDNTKGSCENILCPIGSYRAAKGHCVQFVKIMNKVTMQLVFQLRSVDNGDLVDLQNKTEVDNLFDMLKTKMKDNGLYWCFGQHYIQYVNDAKSTPVIALYTANIQLNDIKTDKFYELMRNLMRVPIEISVNGQKLDVRLVLYHSAIGDQLSLVYKFPDRIAKMPTSHTVFKPQSIVLSICPITYDVHISKVTFCEQVILERSEVIPENTEDGSRIFVISRGKYLYDFIVDIDSNIRICVDDFIQLEASTATKDQNSSTDFKEGNKIQINLTKGMSFLGLFLDASFLTSAIVALCLCKELPKAVKIKNLQLVINLKLIQILLLISIILSVSGTACSVVGLCVHFLSLSVQFIASMSVKVSSPSPTITIPVVYWRKIIMSILKPHLLAFGLVTMSACFSVYYSNVGELGHGSWKTMCFITDDFHRIISFLVPLGIASVVTVYSVITSFYERERRPNQDNHDIPQNNEYGPVHLCFCLLNLITWLSEYFGYDTGTSLVIFIVLNSIQCIFLSVCLIVICRRISHKFTVNEISMM